MDVHLRIFLLAGVLVYLMLVVYFLKKGRLNVKYSLLWLFSALLMLIMIVFPQLVIFIASAVGIHSPVNMIFVLQGGAFLLILLSLTAIVSKMTDRIYILTQTNAIMEKRIRELENKIESRK